MRLRSCALALVAGCFYSPGSFHTTATPFPGKHISVGCLDVALTLTDDRLAPPPVVEYSFGNGCLHSTLVDLTAARVVGRYVDGSVVELSPYDPKHELLPLPIDGMWYGQEEIAYVAGERPPDEVCIDASRINGAAADSNHWVCLSAREGGLPCGG